MTPETNQPRRHSTVRRIRDIGEVLFALVFLFSPLHILMEMGGTMVRGILHSLPGGRPAEILTDTPPLGMPVRIEGKLVCDGLRPVGTGTGAGDVQVWQVHPTVGRARRLEMDMDGSFEALAEASDGPALIRVVMPSQTTALLHIRRDLGRWHSIRVLAVRAPPS